MDKRKVSALVKSLAGGRPLAELARKSGIDAQCLRSWDRMDTLPSGENLARLADYAGYSVEDLRIHLSETRLRERAGCYVVSSADQAIVTLTELPKPEKLKLAKLLLDDAIAV